MSNCVCQCVCVIKLFQCKDFGRPMPACRVFLVKISLIFPIILSIYLFSCLLSLSSCHQSPSLSLRCSALHHFFCSRPFILDFVLWLYCPFYQHPGLPFCLNSVQFKRALLAWQAIIIMFYLYLFTYYFLIHIAKAVYNWIKKTITAVPLTGLFSSSLYQRFGCCHYLTAAETQELALYMWFVNCLVYSWVFKYSVWRTLDTILLSHSSWGW